MVDTTPTVTDTPGCVIDVGVRLEQGRFMSFADLIDHPKDQHVVTWQPGGAHVQCCVNVGETGKAATFYNVPVNGNIIQCSSTTEFLAADGTYIAAADLKQGDVLKNYPRGTCTVERTPEVFLPRNPAPVFDLTVGGAGNYALAAGPYIKSQQGKWV